MLGREKTAALLQQTPGFRTRGKVTVDGTDELARWPLVGPLINVVGVVKDAAGQAMHGISPGCLGHFHEPGGSRIGRFGDTGGLIFAPEWKTLRGTGKDL